MPVDAVAGGMAATPYPKLRIVLALAAMCASAAVSWQVVRVDRGHSGCIAAAPASDAPALAARRRCLLQRPLDGETFRELGDHASANGDDAADGFYAIAVRREPRDPRTRAALVRRNLAAGDYDATVEHLDALLRIAPSQAEPTLRLALAAPGTPPLLEALADRVADDPPWRGVLTAALATGDPAVAEALLARLAARASLTAPEVSLRATLLERLGRPFQARRIWSRGLPPALARLDGDLFDGGFEHGEGPTPYGWRLRIPGAWGIGLDAEDRVEGSTSLGLLLDGRVLDVLDVAQDLVLPPGNYLLELQANLDLESGGRGFAWLVACRGVVDDAPARLGLPQRTGGWKRFTLAFPVSAACPLQRLSLVHEGRNPGERRPVGKLGVDAMRLVRSSQ